MKNNKLFLTISIPLFAGLALTACETANESVFGLSITVALDKTEARIGDTVTATVIYKNINNGSIEVELPDWIVSEGGKNKQDMLIAVFSPEGDFNWHDYHANIPDVESQKRPKFLIKKYEVVMRIFNHTITETENIEVNAAVFFYYGVGGGIGWSKGFVGNIKPAIIKVQ